MADVQTAPEQLNWQELAQKMGVGTPEEAVELAYKIAKYVAEVERDENEKLMLKQGHRYYDLSLTPSAKK